MFAFYDLPSHEDDIYLLPQTLNTLISVMIEASAGTKIYSGSWRVSDVSRNSFFPQVLKIKSDPIFFYQVTISPRKHVRFRLSNENELTVLFNTILVPSPSS